MGDVILITPALAALKARHPRARLDVVLKARYADLLRGHPGVDGLFVLHPGEGIFSLAKRLRRERYNIVLDLHANLRSRMLSLLLPGVRKVRYRKGALRRRLLLQPWIGSDPSVHTVDLYLRSLRSLGIRAERDRPRLFLEENDLDFSRRFGEEHHLDDAVTVVGLHPGARWPGKRWSAERFAWVGRELEKRGHVRVLVFGGPGEEELSRRVADQIGTPAVAAGGLSIRQLMALIARCAVVITNDSGPMHLATALDVPVVAVFGPTHPALGFWPLGERDAVLTADLKCSPCSLHGKKNCPRNRACLEEVKARDVLAAVEKILDQMHVGSQTEIEFHS
jgi:lipopolysaccharide heptosyltransferase II